MRQFDIVDFSFGLFVRMMIVGMVLLLVLVCTGVIPHEDWEGVVIAKGVKAYTVVERTGTGMVGPLFIVGHKSVQKKGHFITLKVKLIGMKTCDKYGKREVFVPKNIYDKISLGDFYSVPLEMRNNDIQPDSP